MQTTENDLRIDVIYTPEVIAARVEELAQGIAAAKLEPLLIIAILKGSFVFAADLMRALHRAGLTPEVDFLTLASYHRGTVSTGQVQILRDLEAGVKGRNVLIVDDILESGRTLAFAKDLVVARGAKSTRTCVLLQKPVERVVQINPDWCGFTCPSVFVVGYGMDVAHKYRELPFVGHVVKG